MKTVIGIMGPGESAEKEELTFAYEVGRLLAGEGYVVLTGGRNCGIMEYALKGAKKAGGTTIGILPGDDDTGMSSYVDIPVFTGMGHARNVINILSSRVVIAVGMGAGTSSEISMALKNRKPVILACQKSMNESFFKNLGNVYTAGSPEDVLELVIDIIPA